MPAVQSSFPDVLKPVPIEDAASESALAEELARIMARKPLRRPPGALDDRRPLAGTLSDADSLYAAAQGVMPGDSEAATSTQASANAVGSAVDAESATALPAWVSARRRRTGRYRAGLVGASLVAVCVVVGIVGGAALTLFARQQDIDALRRVLHMASSTAATPSVRTPQGPVTSEANMTGANMRGSAIPGAAVTAADDGGRIARSAPSGRQ